jgi:tetratricopeptide (TPR) repeat protein
MKNNISLKVSEFWQWLERSKVVPHSERSCDDKDDNIMIDDYDISTNLQTLVDVIFEDLQEVSAEEELAVIELLLTFSEKYITSIYADICVQTDYPDWSREIVINQLLESWEYLCRYKNLSAEAEEKLFEFTDKYCRNYQQYSNVLNSIARIYANNKEDERAALYYERCWHEDMTEFDYIARCESLQRIKCYQEIVDLLTPASDKFPQNNRIWLELGFAYEQLKEYHACSTAFSRAIVGSESSKSHNYQYYKYALNRQANCYMRLNDPWRAFFQFNQMLSINSSSAEEIAKQRAPEMLNYIPKT